MNTEENIKDLEILIRGRLSITDFYKLGKKYMTKPMQIILLL